MKIVQAPEKVLSEKAKPVEKIDEELLDLIEKMKHTLLTASDPKGVGLAAPQVGKSISLFLMKPHEDSSISIVINPKVKLIGDIFERKNKSGHPTLEGCLSIKDIWGTVKRAKKLEMEYVNENWKNHKEIFEGWPAIIIQHEYDHLQGTLFTSRVLEQSGKLYKSHKDKKGEEVFDLIEL